MCGMIPPMNRPTFYSGARVVPVSPALVDALGLAPRSSRQPYPEVLVQPAWLEAPLTAEWTLALRLAAQAGGAVVTEIRVFPTETWRGRPAGEWSGVWLGRKASVPRGGATLRLLRKVKIGHYVKRELTAFLRWVRATAPGAALGYEPDTWLGGPVRTPPRRGGRAQRRARTEDEYLALVAELYVKAMATDRRRVGELVGIQIKRAPRDVAGLVSEARKRGLLTATTQGRAGGRLTSKGRRLRSTTPTKKTRRQKT